MRPNPMHRRALLRAMATTSAALAAGCAGVATRSRARPHAVAATEPEVGPAEDLMREHGVLNRILLVYDEVAHRIKERQAAPTAPLRDAADLVRRFVEDYHERLEENFLFPRFERAGRLVELVAVLRLQHERGRALTDDILRLAGSGDKRGRARLHDALRRMVRMYRPHAAREDTVLFPAFRRLVSEREYADLGERFEDEEHRRFGPRGFEDVVERVATIERTLGIYELSRFAPG